MKKEEALKHVDLKNTDRHYIKEPFTITISGDDTAENIKKAKTLSKHFDEGSTGIMTQTFGAK